MRIIGEEAVSATHTHTHTPHVCIWVAGVVGKGWRTEYRDHVAHVNARSPSLRVLFYYIAEAIGAT